MKRWKWLVIGVCLVLGLSVAVYGFKVTYYPVAPKPHQDIADALAEYGWIVKDLEVDAIKRTIRIAVIPPEDDEGYANGFYYILEWADEIIQPPLIKGQPIRGIYPGVLLIGELTLDGPRVLLANGKIVQAVGLSRVMTLTWEAAHLFLSDKADGTPWREVFDTRDEIHEGVYQLSWFGIAYYAEYPRAEAYEVLDNGWYKIPEEPKVELLEEKK